MIYLLPLEVFYIEELFTFGTFFCIWFEDLWVFCPFYFWSIKRHRMLMDLQSFFFRFSLSLSQTHNYQSGSRTLEDRSVLLLSSRQNSIFVRPIVLPWISGIWLYLKQVVISIGVQIFFLLTELMDDGLKNAKRLVIFLSSLCRFLPPVLLHLPRSIPQVIIADFFYFSAILPDISLAKNNQFFPLLFFGPFLKQRGSERLIFHLHCLYEFVEYRYGIFLPLSFHD